MEKKTTKQQVEEFCQAAGAMAEASFVYYRAVLDSGASVEEAIMLTQVFMKALLCGRQEG